jgi:peptidoglycan/xylan/chitin deacetylase (PgdA/CDA1 family)
MFSHFISFVKVSFISIQIVLFCAVSIFAQTGFDTKIRVAKWADDRQSAFTFSFDDGFLSHYQNAAPILNQFGFKSTFNVMPPFLTETLPGIWRYGTWPMFIQLADEGHEIASHTMNHYYLTSLPVGDTITEGTALYELYQSKKKIEERIPGYKCITMAYPYSDRNEFVDSLASLFYEAARSAATEPNDYSLNYFYDLNSYVVHFDLPRNTLADDLDELYSFMSWTHNSILNEQWAIMMIHEIVPQSELPDLVSQGLYEPISNEWFTLFCEWIKSKSDNREIWVETTANIVRYMKQRDNYEYQIISSTTDEIKINITDDLYDEIYNYPLSVYVTVPEEWNYVLSTQSNRIDTLTSITTDSGKVVLSKIIPDGGIASFTKLNITGIEDEQVQPLAFELYQNYPNPFNPLTVIRYQLSVNSYVTLRVYDALGKEIATLVNDYKQAGSYQIEFNVAEVARPEIASGVYFYQLRAGNYTTVKKMILLR